MADLITLARAKNNLNNQATTAAEDTTLAALISACSQAIQRYCRREFLSRQYDELHTGCRREILVLNQYPILGIARVAIKPTTVLTVQNQSANNQRATVAVTGPGLSLVHVASGTVTTHNLAFADNVTLAALKSAIDGLGSGWSASIPNDVLANLPAADLRAIQGAKNARDFLAELRIHVQELSDFEVDEQRGILTRACGWWFGWGPRPIRVIYTAGYANVPEDVQEACAQWVAALFWQTKRDPGLAHEAIPGMTTRAPFSTMPPTVQQLLQPYRAFNISLEGR